MKKYLIIPLEKAHQMLGPLRKTWSDEARAAAMAARQAAHEAKADGLNTRQAAVIAKALVMKGRSPVDAVKETIAHMKGQDKTEQGQPANNTDALKAAMAKNEADAQKYAHDAGMASYFAEHRDYLNQAMNNPDTRTAYDENRTPEERKVLSEVTTRHGTDVPGADPEGNAMVGIQSHWEDAMSSPSIGRTDDNPAAEFNMSQALDKAVGGRTGPDGDGLDSGSSAAGLHVVDLDNNAFGVSSVTGKMFEAQNGEYMGRVRMGHEAEDIQKIYGQHFGSSLPEDFAARYKS